MKKPWYSFLYVKTTVGKVVWGIFALLVTLGFFLFFAVIENRRMEAHTANWEGRAIEKGAEIYANNCYTCHGVNGEGMLGRAPALNSRYFFENRLDDLGISGSLHDYVAGTVAAGRPSNTLGQWSAVMPTWGEDYGGPLRNDQVSAVSDFILNWESTALLQTEDEDPWQPFTNAVTSGITGTVSAPSGPVEGEVRAPGDLFTSLGCSACHNLDQPQTADNRGPVGPNLGNLADIAAAEAPDMTPEEYVQQSIVDPAAHIAAGYVNGIMPQTFGNVLSEEEVQALAAWLLDPNRE
jgi:mono/diheme cytochrome c family protein